MSDSVTPWSVAHQASLSFTISWSVLKLMSIESVMPSNHVILCHLLLLLPSVFPSIRVFSNELAFRIRWLKYWSFSFSISPSNEYSGFISFRIDWFDLFAVPGTLKCLLQHHSLKNISSFVLSLLYGPTLISVHDYWKNHSFDYMDLCQQWCLCLLMLPRFAIAFLPRKQMCYNFIAAVTIHIGFGPKKLSLSVFPLFPSLFAMKW